VSEAAEEAQENEFPEGAILAEDNPILLSWKALACIGFDGFLKFGRGYVKMDRGNEESSEITVTFEPGIPCSCHQELVEKYNPEEEIVVMTVWEDGDETVEVCWGLPPPVDIWEETPVPDETSN
jgi:hypothetical protein